jgi:hypothetical protein
MVPLIPPTQTKRPLISQSSLQALPRQTSKEVRQWTVEDVAEWLVRVGLGEHAETFRANKVDGECLQLLNNDLLKNDLNIAALGNRQRILRKVQTLKT